ncbi:poly(R)-hydroxyalkanoic acid synthase subunit PhaE [Pseudoxanthomonas suwonensis]|uniref:poly(R)-hydroxyalkanoic acid synthase subunit PhaE n=1 Tax=Pseudoxanthomonas suwonensis TaxID=314722 RepID=UPI00138EEEAF|nr:poly(R)-hydroxyalkanoic acid synthase subunit PhaE [Pseudoxanthomonas suwonensis]
MANASSPGDLDSLARQYWDTWGGLLGVGPSTATSDAFGFGGATPGEGPAPAAFDWYARMQQVAAQFAEGGGSAADVAGAWRQMLGGQAGNPFAGVLHGLPGGLGAAAAGWPDQVRPIVEALLRPLRQQASEWFGRPGLGPGREHQQRLQALAAAWQEWEERNEAFTALLSRISQDAFARFERLLEQQESPEQRLATARALFDLWVEAAEEAWSEAALSEEYQENYAALTNALMRVRRGLQHEVERLGELLGLPGRTEVDSVHRKVAELERTVRELRRAAGLAQGRAASAGAPAARPRKAAVAGASADTGTRKAAAPAARKPATRKPASSAEARPATRTGAAKVSAPKKVAGKAGTRAGGKAQAAKAAAMPKAAASVARPVAGKPAKAAATNAVASPKRAAAGARPAAKRGGAKAAAAAGQSVAAKKPAARKAAGAASAPAKAPATRPAKAAAAGVPRPRKAQPAAPAQAGARVVSIKDWVSRNLAAAKPDGGRGGRGR